MDDSKKCRILVSDPIAEEGIAVLSQNFICDVKTKLPPEELKAIIGDYDALMVRSETKVTSGIIQAGTKLKIIGRAGVGVDNIDVQEATKHGIIVVNSPGGNTIAAAELSMALMLSMSRKVPQANASLLLGEWKRSKFVGNELYKKTLGIVGLGRIGSEVAKRARSFGMTVIASDPYASPEKAKELGITLTDLDNLYDKSDYITVHVPKTDNTKGMINSETIAKMKDGVRIINAARGGIINEDDLCEAIKSGKVAGAAFDVFAAEPPPADHPLIHLPQVLATPHLGASTEEAQTQVAIDVAEQIDAVLSGGTARSPVNLPPIPADAFERSAPYLELSKKLGQWIAQVVSEPALNLQIFFEGNWAEIPTETIARSALAGFLNEVLSDPVNLVNAVILAQQRGLSWTHTYQSDSKRPFNVIRIEVDYPSGKRTVEGIALGPNELKIIRVDGYRVDMTPEGWMLVTKHTDRPGMIGNVGTLLGSKGINIGGMIVGRASAQGQAVMILQVDTEINQSVIAEIRAIPGMEKATLVHL